MATKDNKSEKIVKSINKSVRSSTRKLNPILRSIVGKKVEVALRDLTFSDKRISKDIKNEIARLIKDGYSDDEIFELMKNRYGNYILLNSGEDKMPIYLIPLIALIISILAVTTYTIKKSKWDLKA